jgi:hypothetical protein
MGRACLLHAASTKEPNPHTVVSTGLHRSRGRGRSCTEGSTRSSPQAAGRDARRRLALARGYWFYPSDHHGDDRLSRRAHCSRCKPAPWPDKANPQPCNWGSEAIPFGTTGCTGLDAGELSSPHTYSANNPATVNAFGAASNPIFVTGRRKRGILILARFRAGLGHGGVGVRLDASSKRINCARWRRRRVSAGPRFHRQGRLRSSPTSAATQRQAGAGVGSDKGNARFLCSGLSGHSQRPPGVEG